MGVTICINNDKDSSICQEYECQCIDYDGKPVESCKHCHGTGNIKFYSSKWELDMCYHNFRILFSSLGLDTPDTGFIHPCIIIKSIKTVNPQLCVRDTVIDGNVINCGIDEDYVTRKLKKLMDICMEAAKREEIIVWG